MQGSRHTVDQQHFGGVPGPGRILRRAAGSKGFRPCAQTGRVHRHGGRGAAQGFVRRHAAAHRTVVTADLLPSSLARGQLPAVAAEQACHLGCTNAVRQRLAVAGQVLAGIEPCLVAALGLQPGLHVLPGGHAAHGPLHREGVQDAAPVHGLLAQPVAQGQKRLLARDPVQVLQQRHQVGAVGAELMAGHGLVPVLEQPAAPQGQLLQQGTAGIMLIHRPGRASHR